MNTLTTPAAPASTKTEDRSQRTEASNLRYDHESGRWCIGDHDLHCGDCFDLYADRKDLPPIPVRIEHASAGWYVITPYGITQLSTRRASL